MKFLVIKASAGGDIIQALSVLDYLRQRFVGCEVDWVVEERFKELITEANPIVMDTKGWRGRPFCYQTWKRAAAFIGELRKKRYDHVIDLQGNCKSGLVMWLSKSRNRVGFNRDRVAEWPNLLASNRRYPIDKGLSIRQEYLQLVQSHFGDSAAHHMLSNTSTECRQRLVQSLPVQTELQVSNSCDQTILLCPFSNWPSKELPAQTAQLLMERIHDYDGSEFLVVWGNERERQCAEQYCCRSFVRPLAHRHSMDELMALMEGCRAVIAVDSLPLHLAGRTSCPVLSLFGPSSAQKFAPDRSIALQGGCPYGEHFEGRCERLRKCADHPCMTSWSIKQLFDNYRRIHQQA